MHPSSFIPDPGPGLGGRSPKNATKNGVISVRFAQNPSNTPEILTIEDRIKALISAVIQSGTPILPFELNSTATTIDNMANIPSIHTFITTFLTRPVKVQESFSEKSELKFPFQKSSCIPSKATLVSYFISLDEAHITTDSCYSHHVATSSHA